MADRFDHLKSVGMFRLVKDYVKTGRKLAALDRSYALAEGKRLLKTYSPSLALVLGALLCFLNVALIAIVTLWLVLDIWLAPWLAGLVIMLILGCFGMYAFRRGMTSLREGAVEAKSLYAKIKEDVQCLKQ